MIASNVCPRCSVDLQRDLWSFAKRHGITTASEDICRVLLNQTEYHFPGLKRFILEPSMQETQVAELFPINPRRVSSDRVSVQLVDAPLPFTAAVVSCHCSQCHCNHRVIHIGIPFYITVSHMQAFLDGSHSQPAQDLARFIAMLHAPNPRWRSFPTPPASTTHSAMLASGMAWLLCHEVGHFADGDALNVEVSGPLSASPTAKTRFSEELNADAASLLMLVHRTKARGAQTHPRLSLLYLGIGLMLRSWHVCIPRHQRAQDFLSYGPRLGAFIPSPTQRWAIVKKLLEAELDLGFIPRTEYEALERKLLGQDTPRINQLIGELDGIRDLH